MRTVICKPDLDTCLAALILGVEIGDTIEITAGKAEKSDLANPAVRCIECGGSGQSDLNNYDHHDSDLTLAPACRQALATGRKSAPGIARLVDYVCCIDDGLPLPAEIPFPSLSNLFSGMMAITPEPLLQFRLGMSMLDTILQQELNPFERMPDLPEWQPYSEAKRQLVQSVEKALATATLLHSHSGLTVGVLRSAAIGGAGHLYDRGCDVVILYGQLVGSLPLVKFTIASRTENVMPLAALLCQQEPGWGGKCHIIGSPRTGSRLNAEDVISLVLRNC